MLDRDDAVQAFLLPANLQETFCHYHHDPHVHVRSESVYDILLDPLHQLWNDDERTLS